MNYIDLLLLLLIAFSGLTGWHRGFILGSLDLLRWLASLLAGLWLYPDVANILSRFTDWDDTWLLPLSFLLVAFLCSLLLQYFGSLLLQRLPYHIHYHRLNQALGTVPGLLSGLVTTAIVAVLLLALPLTNGVAKNVDESRVVNRMALYTDRLETLLEPVYDRAVQRTLNRLTVAPESETFVELPFKVTRFEPRPDLEEQMLELINQERQAHGLQPLTADPYLQEVARSHAADMFSRGYFSHYTPEGRSPFDRIRDSRIRFRTAGENLAMAPTLKIAHQGLMNSPGHRANILQKNFGRVGIAVLEGGRHQLMITQNFRN